MLNLRVADTFWLRLCGVSGVGRLAPDQGLMLVPCRAIHTFFLSEPLDLVFLDKQGRERRCVHQVPPYRVVVEPSAYMVVELPAGYCLRHSDYLCRIHAALRLRVSPRLSR